MNTNRPNTPNQWEEFYGPNLGYVIELYEQYKDDPDSVDPTFKELFEQWGAPALTRENDNAGVIQAAGITEADMMKVASALKLMENIRAYGHLSAEIYPFDVKRQKKTEFLNPATYGLTENDLQSISAKILWSDAPSDVKTGLDAVNRLKELYTKSLSYEFSHVHEAEERNWLTHMVESGSIQRSLSNEERVHLLRRLTEVEGFEQFLHKTFVGQKRFSIEGVDVLVPMLDDIIFEGVRDGAKNVMIGMAHRGRLNVLAHVLGKPYEIIFSEFHHSPNKELVPSEGSKGINYGWTGDVKYHLGGVRAIKESNSLEARLTLANNPSHLEFVNPVVEGYTRAAQEDRTSAGFPQQDVQKSF
uniref:thiamine pyrophosphate-dependent enzyme n=2 Tax=Fictibacillus TaxID=1329200 RepID=UPI0004786816